MLHLAPILLAMVQLYNLALLSSSDQANFFLLKVSWWLLISNLSHHHIHNKSLSLSCYGLMCYVYRVLHSCPCSYDSPLIMVLTFALLFVTTNFTAYYVLCGMEDLFATHYYTTFTYQCY